jgi:hypothetical protein
VLGISAIQVRVRVRLTLLRYQSSIAKLPCFRFTVRGAVNSRVFALHTLSWIRTHVRVAGAGGIVLPSPCTEDG